jgi:hypothetical protein
MAADLSASLITYDPDLGSIQSMQKFCMDRADEALKAHGWLVDDASRLKFANAVAAAMDRATRSLELLAQGEYLGVQSRPRVETATTKAPVSLEHLVDRWAKERTPRDKTMYEWRRVAREFVKFLGYDDANRITRADIIRWKQDLVDRGLHAKTIRDAKLEPIRAIFRWPPTTH